MSGNKAETAPRLVVIVPTWQECDNILPLIEALRAGGHVREIPVAFDDRLHGDSKFGVSDIMEFAAWCLSARFRD
jgi:hypothetical protein